jgi:thiopeptide-type bacteriocin biosynthesis protein
MRYHFADHMLLRMPVKSPGDYRADPQIFLNDPFFQAALKIATPGFYALLENKGFQANELNIKEQYTLQKYINRYCFRPTPFGLFASVSLIKWGIRAEQTIATSNLIAHITTAMPVQHQLYEKWRDQELAGHARYEPNPSIYRVLHEYRFFRTGLDEAGKQRDYQLQSIAFSKMLKDLLKLCSTGCSKTDLTDHIIMLADCERAEAADYVDFLIDAQLLVHTTRMPINGDDYLMQISEKLDNLPLKTVLRNYLKLQNIHREMITPDHIGKVEKELQKLIPDQILAANQLNIILKRHSNGESPSMDLQGQLRDAITALNLLSADGQASIMVQFINSYQQHFEGQTLPLLQALDPEAGIGYQQPEREKHNPLLETLNIPYRDRSTPSNTWTAGHRLLMETWLRTRSSDIVIRLEEEDLAQLGSGQEPQPIMGMSILFRIAENKVFIENAGGINAPALMGRFTIADDDILNAATHMAKELETLNPHIVFAELLHHADPHTDNVNRRAHIYHYEIPITAASVLPKARQIQLSDLYVRIINNKVVLFSQQHKKVVIPRLSSAYNHSLNKLPLFRFLTDIPYQFSRSNLSLDLRQFFPDLRFYPRVEYKDTILSLATWVLSSEQISALAHDPVLTSQAFARLCAEIKLPRYFALAEGDQELVFDSQNLLDIDLFMNAIQQKKEVRLKEFLSQTEIRQYNAYMLPSEPLRMPANMSSNRSTTKVQRKYIPGSSWLYLKIYAPKIGMNRLLLRLMPLLRKRYANHPISQWFFIRYEDHAPHIRLRLKVNPEGISEVLIAFKSKLEDRIQQQVIREFQIDVYTRELERYAAGGIEQTEHLFWRSSQLVVDFLKHHKTNAAAHIHIFALYSTQAMIVAFIPGIDEQIDFTLTSYQQFLPEFTDKPFKVELDKKYRDLAPEIMAAFGRPDTSLFSGSSDAGKKLLDSLRILNENVGDKSKKTDYLRSIIHMHLNRIFTDDSRKQEMICYYLLHKYLLSVKGRNKHSR